MKLLTFTLSMVFMVFTISSLQSQSWKYSKGGNAFDGTYRTSYVKGKGGNFPYDNPTFVINLYNEDNLNIYITNAGYFGCDYNRVLFLFDDDKDNLYYTSSVSTNNENDNLFIGEIQLQDNITNEVVNIGIDNFLEIIKESSKMHLRVSSECIDNYDYTFNLSGSSKAINFVVGDYFIKIRKRIAELTLEAEKLKEELKHKRIEAEKQKIIEAEKLKEELEQKRIEAEELKRIEAEKLKEELEQKRIEAEELKRIEAEKLKEDSIRSEKIKIRFQEFEISLLEIINYCEDDEKQFEFNNKQYSLQSKKKSINKEFKKLRETELNLNGLTSIENLKNLNSQFKKEVLAIIFYEKPNILIEYLQESVSLGIDKYYKNLYFLTILELYTTLNVPSQYKVELMTDIRNVLHYY